jgi:hypothetical protein
MLMLNMLRWKMINYTRGYDKEKCVRDGDANDSVEATTGVQGVEW